LKPELLLLDVPLDDAPELPVDPLLDEPPELLPLAPLDEPLPPPSPASGWLEMVPPHAARASATTYPAALRVIG
jgi:hypothetical protein